MKLIKEWNKTGRRTEKKHQTPGQVVMSLKKAVDIIDRFLFLF